MKKLFLSLTVLSMAVAWHPPALAQNETTPVQTEQPAPVEFTQTRAQRIANRCTILTERTSQLSAALSASQTRSANLAGGLQTKLGEFADRAENAGLNVAQLKSDLAEMGTLSDNLSASWQEFIESIEKIGQSASCGSDNLDAESVHTAIEEAKDAKAEVRQSLANLIEFVKTTIKHDLTDIRQQLADLNQETG